MIGKVTSNKYSKFGKEWIIYYCGFFPRVTEGISERYISLHLQGLNSDQSSLVSKNYTISYDIKAMDYKTQMNRKKNVLARKRI